jgi:hypothetical protein
VRREQLGTLVGCLPFAFAAGHEDRHSRLVGKPIEGARSTATSLLRRRIRARGSASTSAHHSSVVGSCGCDQERLSTASRACTMAATNFPTSGRLPSRMTKFGVGRVIQATIELSLLAVPTLGERLHSGLARLLVAMRQRA